MLSSLSGFGDETLCHLMTKTSEKLGVSEQG